MPLENINRAPFSTDIRRPNPQKQSAALQLILQVMCMMRANPFRYDSPNQPTTAASCDDRGYECRQRTSGGDDNSRRRHCADIHKCSDDPALRIADRFGRYVRGSWQRLIIRDCFDFHESMTELLVNCR